MPSIVLLVTSAAAAAPGSAALVPALAVDGPAGNGGRVGCGKDACAGLYCPAGWSPELNAHNCRCACTNLASVLSRKQSQHVPTDHVLQNKTIWMFWEQGEAQLKGLASNASSRYREDHRCVLGWRRLNPTWEVRLLDRDEAERLAPLYAKQAGKPEVTPALRSDLLRLELLSRYGGVWADVSACPTQPLDSWLTEAVRPSGYFTYWLYHDYNREIDSQVLAVRSVRCPLV